MFPTRPISVINVTRSVTSTVATVTPVATTMTIPVTTTATTVKPVVTTIMVSVGSSKRLSGSKTKRTIPTFTISTTSLSPHLQPRSFSTSTYTSRPYQIGWVEKQPMLEDIARPPRRTKPAQFDDVDVSMPGLLESLEVDDVEINKRSYDAHAEEKEALAKGGDAERVASSAKLVGRLIHQLDEERCVYVIIGILVALALLSLIWFLIGVIKSRQFSKKVKSGKTGLGPYPVGKLSGGKAEHGMGAGK